MAYLSSWISLNLFPFLWLFLFHLCRQELNQELARLDDVASRSAQVSQQHISLLESRYSYCVAEHRNRKGMPGDCCSLCGSINAEISGMHLVILVMTFPHAGHPYTQVVMLTRKSFVSGKGVVQSALLIGQQILLAH